MAPEQAAGRNRDVGPATDVYALGATLYEILTGRPPFRGETPTETLRMVIESECVSPRILRPGVARDLETICLKCLEKDPARRYPSAASLREDIERFLRGEPIHARSISVRLRAAKWVRRRPAHAGALVLVTLLASGLVGGIVYRDALLQSHALRLEHEVARADASAKLARRHLSAFQLRQAKQALDAHQVERAQNILSAMHPDGKPPGDGQAPDDRGFAWHYLMSQACQNLVVLSDRRSERVSEAALSQDGRTLATGDNDGTIRLRDPQTGQGISRLLGHKICVDHLAFSPDGSRLASVGQLDSSRRGEVFLWDLVTARILGRFDGFSDRSVEDMRFDHRGERLWEVSVHDKDGRRLGLWDVKTEPVRPRLMWSEPIRTVHLPVSNNGSIVALEEPGRRFVVREIDSMSELGRTTPIEHGYKLSMPSPDGRLLAVGGSRTVSLWDVSAGRENDRFALSRDDLGSIHFSHNGRYLALVFQNGEFVVRDLQTGAVHAVPTNVANPGRFISVAFSPDDRFVASNVSSIPGGPQPTVIWKLDPWHSIATYPGMVGATMAPQFTTDGTSAILAVEHTAIRWNYSRPAFQQPSGHADEAWSLAFSPDASVLASGSDDTDEPQTIKLWDTATGRLVKGWNAGEGTVSALSFHPSGRIMASGHLGTPGEIRLWAAATGRRLATLAGHTDSVRTLAFSPDGALLATAGSDLSIRIWDVAARECRQVLSGHTDTVASVAFSGDGKHLASAGCDRTIHLWDLASRRAAKLPWVEKISALAYSPNGRTLAAADEDGQIIVWDPMIASRIQTIASDEKELRCLTISPDGETLATAGKGCTIRLWDPATGQELLSLEGHKAQINCVAFSPDGQILASCSHDGAVKLWRGRRE